MTVPRWRLTRPQLVFLSRVLMADAHDFDADEQADYAEWLHQSATKLRTDPAYRDRWAASHNVLHQTAMMGVYAAAASCMLAAVESNPDEAAAHLDLAAQWLEHHNDKGPDNPNE